MAQTYNWDEGILFRDIPQSTLVVLRTEEKSYRELLESKNSEELENVFLEHISTEPLNIHLPLTVLRILIKRKEQERALPVLQLYIETLQELGNTPTELLFLRTLLAFWPECRIVSDTLLAHCKNLYGNSPGFEKIVKNFQDVPNLNPLERLRQIELWLRYNEGRTVYLPSKGVGRITEINLVVGTVRLQFESAPDDYLSLRITEAQRLAEALPKGHFLSLKADRLQEYIKLAESDPAELLRLFFASVKREVPIQEIKEMLWGVVPEAKWNAWWNKVRQDPRISTEGTGTKAVIRWSDSVNDAAASIISKFDAVGPYEKLDMAQKYASRYPDYELDFYKKLAEEADKAINSAPAMALEIALALEKHAGKLTFSFSLLELLKRDDAADLVMAVQDRLLRKRAVSLLEEINQKWLAMYGRMIRNEGDNQILNLLYEKLHEHERAVLERIIDETLSNPVEAPRLFMWICREILARFELKPRASWSFIQAVLRALDNAAFKGNQAALRKLFDPAEPVDHAIMSLDLDKTRQMLDVLGRLSTLEDYRKDRLREEMYYRFPELREVGKQIIYVTEVALTKMRESFEKLVRSELPENALEIKRTREYGDLRENFEYHAARARQELLSSRAKTLHDQLNSARVIDPAKVDTSVISVGARILLQGVSGHDEKINLTILGPWDSDPARNILSYTSAAAESILGARQGSTITFNDKQYTVESIKVWTDPE